MIPYLPLLVMVLVNMYLTTSTINQIFISQSLPCRPLTNQSCMSKQPVPPPPSHPLSRRDVYISRYWCGAQNRICSLIMGRVQGDTKLRGGGQVKFYTYEKWGGGGRKGFGPVFQSLFQSLREWSLITGRGGLQNGRGGAREVLPLRKGGAEKVLAILKGGHKNFWGRFYAVA